MTIRLRHLLLALPLLILGWIAVLALVLRLGGPAPAVLVVLPPEGFWAELPADAAIISRSGLGVVLGGGPDLVPGLYAAGAWLVLPAGLAGCFGPQAQDR